MQRFPLPWIAVRYAETSPDGFFGLWLLSVLVVDGICLVIDVVDVLRYLAGDRRPVVSAQDGCALMYYPTVPVEPDSALQGPTTDPCSEDIAPFRNR